MSLFEQRVNLKPYEYPELLRYMKAIRQSYWVVDEFNLTQDIQDFFLISPKEKNIVKNAILAIAQIEVSVKTFWGDLYSHMPKPEIGAVGYTFAESEVRHMESYSELLELLGLNREFEKIKDIPAINDRVDYLTKSLRGAKSRSQKEYVMSLLLFSIFIENVSLFSQFLILMSFNKYRNTLRGVSNIIQATSQEEALHGQFGMSIVNIIREENPEWFDEEFTSRIIQACNKAYKAETKILDWIFEEGELDFLSRDAVENFIKDRYNSSLVSVGIEPVFEVDAELLLDTKWFDEETTATSHVDFFAKRPTSYSKFQQAITEDDLF
jgi:ribonucleoside-diphosphate reductase beta chain